MDFDKYNTDDYQSTLVGYISEHIVQIPWQHEHISLSNDQNKLHYCLGISPSQFQRLMSTRQDFSNANEIAVLYARTALQYTLEQKMKRFHDNSQTMFIVLIVDAIQKYNFAVFHNKHIKTGVALKYALDEGTRLFKIFSEARSQLPLKLAQRVILLRWHDIHDAEYDKCVMAIRAHLFVSEKFHTLINAVVQHYFDVRKPQGNLSETKHELLREYVLYELPSLIRGINYNTYHCSVIIHPTLTSSIRKNDHQRNLMIHLLEYVRNSPILLAEMGINQSSNLCNIYDIDMPIDVPLTLLSTISNSKSFFELRENSVGKESF
ncbi:unnamed protein product [Rotaria sordida]|uniref:Uncharacterized protein n=1 Tax=Rotaria sordida TaxID=392033 RepID=A0A815EVS2_9BILA|nr:unnamed protein product [Rotaria sordida]CAF4034899.1 unnamed protein product [Rotaria sordida]